MLRPSEDDGRPRRTTFPRAAGTRGEGGDRGERFGGRRGIALLGAAALLGAPWVMRPGLGAAAGVPGAEATSGGAAAAAPAAGPGKDEARAAEARSPSAGAPAIPLAGSPVAAGPAEPVPLSRMRPSRARSLDFLGLALSVLEEIETGPAKADPEAVEWAVEGLALEVRADLEIGEDVDHRRTVTGLNRVIFQRLRLTVLDPRRAFWQPGALHLGRILRDRRAGPAGAALLYLSVAERLFPPTSPHHVPLRPLRAGDATFLVCRDGSLRFYVDLSRGGREISAEALRRAAGLDEGRPLPRGLDPVRFGGRLLVDLARMAARRGDEVRSLGLYRAALELDPRQSEPNLALADDALARGEPAMADGLVAAALAAAPEEPRAFALRARIRRARGDREGARRDLVWLAEKARDSHPEALLALADMAIEDGDDASARAYLAQYGSACGSERGRAEADRRLRELAARPAMAVLRGSKDDARRLRAIHSLRAIRSAGGVACLIEALEDPNLRLRLFAWKALRDLTGADLGPSAEAWRAWWSRKGRQWSAGPGEGHAAARSGEGSAASRKPGRRAGGPTPSPRSAPLRAQALDDEEHIEPVGRAEGGRDEKGGVGAIEP